MQENERVAREFCDKYNGKIVGVIHGHKILKSGEKSRAGYKIKINDKFIIHSYVVKTWHRNRDGVSVSTEQLDEAIDDNALMLMNNYGKELVLHSTIWEKFAKEEGNYAKHNYYDTTEVFCKRGYMQELNLVTYKWEDYYPD